MTASKCLSVFDTSWASGSTASLKDAVGKLGCCSFLAELQKTLLLIITCSMFFIVSFCLPCNFAVVSIHLRLRTKALNSSTLIPDPVMSYRHTAVEPYAIHCPFLMAPPLSTFRPAAANAPYLALTFGTLLLG